jgi:membrane-bound serine protease (ClpP class)
MADIAPLEGNGGRAAPLLVIAALLAALGGIRPGGSVAQEAPTRDGLFITVPNPITDQAVQEIKRKVKQAVDKHRSIETIVFDFNPHGAPSGTTSFGVCYDLADFIRGLPLGHIAPLHPRTIAYVHNQVSNHTVLPVLACAQIVMSLEPDDVTRLPKARLGDVLYHVKGPLKKQERASYEEIANNYASPDLIVRMFEPALPILRVQTDKGERYASPQRIEEWRAKGLAVAVKTEVPAGLEPGKASFDAEKAREFGLCQAFYNSRADLRKALNLPRHSVHEDWFADKQRVAWRIDVNGTLDKGRLDSLRRRINSAIGKGANFLLLDLDTSGGDTTHVAAVAEDLRELRDKSGAYPVKTIAYIPPGAALGAGTYLALACNEIVMASNATLADFNYLKQEPAEALRRREEMLVALAREQDYPELLFQATLTPGLVLYRVRASGDPNDEQLITEAEYRIDQEGAKKWRSLGRLEPADGDMLTIPASLAQSWRIAQATDVDTVEQLYAAYGLDASQVRVSRDDLLDRVAEFFREPIVNFVLIMLGIIGLILEMKLPGTTVPGSLAALCFVLFFWAYSFTGQFTMLAVMLFLLGLALIAVEVFLVPGLGFAGVAGVGLLITSLALVTLERWPQTAQDWTHLGGTVTTLSLSLITAIVAAFVIAWFLPSMPYFHRLVLAPPEELFGDAPAAPLPASLLGAIGVAATALRPAGKAQFGDDFVDVVAEGDYVNAGGRVQVIEIEGNRVVVKEV